VQGLIVVALVTLLMATFLALLLSRSVTKYLDRLKKDTEKFANGELSVRANDKEGAPEIRSLAASFNLMAERISRLIEKQKGFAADASHQLRTPLAGILAQIELALDTKDAAEIQKRLENINESSKRLIHIINQLLSLSKSQSDALHHAEFKPFDLVSFTKKVTSIMLPAADLKHIDLGYEGSEAAIYIMADEARLYDLIHNLIDNAIKYTADYGKITLAVELKDNKVRLTVEDNGVGIPKKNQTMIYERFYRGDNVNTAGAGVGLSIVKDIADFHQATIEIDSRNNKEGTRFYIDFDLMKS